MDTLRAASPKDFAAAEFLTRDAFWNVYKPGCDEHLILHQFRSRPEFLAESEYVIADENGLAAHIMYCRALLRSPAGNVSALMFGPVSVRPDRQRQGLGSRIIRFTLEKAEALGHGAVVITGSPAYYHRFGFEAASSRLIRLAALPPEEDAPFFMVKELRPGFLPHRPFTFQEPEGYTVDAQALEAFEKQFPPRKKERRPGQLA